MGCVYHSVRYCFKSKCSDCNICCGMVKVHRETQQENEEPDEIRGTYNNIKRGSISFSENYDNNV